MKVGVIGFGNLGESFTQGLLKSGVFGPEEIIASDPDEDRLEKAKDLGIGATTDNEEAVEGSEAVFIAVKPSLVGEVLNEVGLSEGTLLVSLAAGVSTGSLQSQTKARVVRVMPNICGRVSEMASAYTLGKDATEEDEKFVADVLNQLGMTVKVEEELMNAITGLSGSGPAYVFLVIKALKEAGAELGLSEEDALDLAAETVKGSGKLALESEKSLEELIDIVSSPKGTTMEGMKILEDEEVKEDLKKAVNSATKRAEELSE